MATVKKTIKKAQKGMNVDSLLSASQKRVKAVTDSARKEEVKKGINTYDDYLKSKIKNKAKKGGSFPDLNKDGKITKADILKGRGVIAKKGAAVKKKAGTHKMPDGSIMKNSMMKSGGKMQKCKYGCK